MLLYSGNLNTYISNSSFFGNEIHKYRFWRYSGSLTFENCYLGDNKEDTGNPEIKSTIIDQSTVLLSHFSTGKCFAEIPLIYTIQNEKSYEIKKKFDLFDIPVIIASYFVSLVT